MPNKKDIFSNKADFAREEFSTELYKPAGRPRPREAASSPGQIAAGHDHTFRKDRKVKMEKKNS